MPRRKLSRSAGAHIIQALEFKSQVNRPWLVRIADSLVSFFGTSKFFLATFATCVIWILVNLGWIPAIAPFDPYPFILLTMIASVGAIFMTIIILISQNRHAAIDTLRSELLLQMILITERELTKALRLIAGRRRLRRSKLDRELAEMLKDTDVSDIEQILAEQLNNTNKPK